MEQNLTFPNNFFFGASISSHQVEGNNHNNWTVWELKNAHRLAQGSEFRKDWTPVWDEIEKDAKNPKNYISGIATDHFNRYREDFDLAKQLNLNSLRFSIEWSRIEPIEGEFNQEAINHYHEYIDELRKRNLEPFMTIWHWSLPVWFEEKGGFTKRKNIKYFTRFVEKLGQEYKEKITYWITLNEPRIYVSESFLNGRWPPQKHSILTYYFTLMNLRESHRKAYCIIKKYCPDSIVGIAENVASYTSGMGLINRLTRKLFAWYELRVIRGYNKYLDFIGLNYYFHRHIHNFNVTKIAENTDKVSDLGWDMYPQGIHSPLVKLKDFKKPVIITENGLADQKDIHREWFITETLKSVKRAIDDGVDVKGYLHWSLTDNFEWDSGFWPRFGLIDIDYKNDFKRTIRKSALKYAEIIRNSEN